VAYAASQEAFYPERVAAVLALSQGDLEAMSEEGMWPDSAIAGLADLLGIPVPWFYALDSIEKAQAASSTGEHDRGTE